MYHPVCKAIKGKMCTCIGQYVVFSTRHPISLARFIASIHAILPSVVKLALLLLGKIMIRN